MMHTDPKYDSSSVVHLRGGVYLPDLVAWLADDQAVPILLLNHKRKPPVGVRSQTIQHIPALRIQHYFGAPDFDFRVAVE